MTQDIGAGPYELPYRWRPLTWKIEGEEYFNERATSTQQTGFSFVSQSRSWLPDPVGGVLWFGVDDTYSTVYTPMYCGITRVPHSFAVGTGSFEEFTWESGFWVFNYVSNYAYLRYSDMIKDVQIVQRELEGRFLADQPEIDAAAKALYDKSPRLAVDYLTDYSVRAGDDTVKRWRKLGEELLFKYLDGNVKDEHGKVTHPGYPESWYRRVAKASGGRLAMKKLKQEEEAHKVATEAEELKRSAIADGVLTLLKARGFTVDQTMAEKVYACKDIKKLEKWLVDAATADAPESLFVGH
ncbi:MAG: dipeptidase, partial [Planctomycetes bacterium]|nr:dipeptidase [Planctomycetota bacterium]